MGIFRSGPYTKTLRSHPKTHGILFALLDNRSGQASIKPPCRYRLYYLTWTLPSYFLIHINLIVVFRQQKFGVACGKRTKKAYTIPKVIRSTYTKVPSQPGNPPQRSCISLQCLLKSNIASPLGEALMTLCKAFPLLLRAFQVFSLTIMTSFLEIQLALKEGHTILPRSMRVI